MSKRSYWEDELGIELRMVKHIGQSRREDNRREKHEETFKHEDFTKYARKTTKSHLIAGIRDAGKVDMLAEGDCHNFLGVLIDGMGK